MSSAICFLIIGDMKLLPSIAIESCLAHSKCDIIIGYSNERDIRLVPRDDRVKFIQLGGFDIGILKEYENFYSEEFYKIVFAKWTLLQMTLEMEYHIVTYLDSDVLVLGNIDDELQKFFGVRNTASIAIQSHTSLPSEPKLCMGIIALRNNDYSKNFLVEAKNTHLHGLATNKMLGDDEVVTSMFVRRDYPAEIVELPQSTFLVGNLVGIFKNSSSFPYLKNPKPFLFHANFAVGLVEKTLLLKYVQFIQRRTPLASKVMSSRMIRKWLTHVLRFLWRGPIVKT